MFVRACYRCGTETTKNGIPPLCDSCLSLWISRLEGYVHKLDDALKRKDKEPSMNMRIMMTSLVRRMQSSIETYCLLVRQDKCDLLGSVARYALETLTVFQDCRNRGYEKVADEMNSGEYWPEGGFSKLSGELGEHHNVRGIGDLYKHLSSLVHPTDQLFFPFYMIASSVEHTYDLSEVRMMIRFSDWMLSDLKSAMRKAVKVGNSKGEVFTHELPSRGAPKSVEEAEDRGKRLIELAREEW